MGSHEHDLTQMEHEIRDLLAKLETKDILIQEHKDAFKSLEQSIEVKIKVAKS